MEASLAFSADAAPRAVYLERWRILEVISAIALGSNAGLPSMDAACVLEASFPDAAPADI
ncbi:MAG: hypothetical protein CL859_04045 [Cyanobium sp. ARS6]|nr:hypothetical protein [Cyanobium sp. ARS6]